MAVPIRLRALATADPQSVRFCLFFAAPQEGQRLPAAGTRTDAWLETGEGPALELGRISAPTAATWREWRLTELATHTYHGLGPFTARLLWGEMLAEATVTPGAGGDRELAAAGSVQLASFEIEDADGWAQGRMVRWAVRGVQAGMMLRVDGGAGQACLAAAGAGQDGVQTGECRLVYAKPGTYTVALEVLDTEGFWLATLAEYPLVVRPPYEAAPSAERPPAYAPVADQPPVAAEEPWLPGRYMRPLWGWLRTYKSPGGGSVARVLPQGVYLSVQAETLVGGALWYQAAGQDWVCGEVVEPVRPSTLRGIALQAGAQAAPAGQNGRYALVTVPALNVRPRPGVRAGNEPVEQLAAGTAVTVYEEAPYGGAVWYRIGEGRWVHSDHVRLAPAPRAARPPAPPPALPAAWVVAPALNVRGHPGLDAGNSPLDRVEHNQVLPILDTYTLGGTPWYQIGAGRWVEGAWVAVAQAKPRPATIRSDERWVAVSLASQTLVAYEGDQPVYAALAATGRSATPTPAGLFRVRRQAERETIAGPSSARGSSYCLEDVPWVTCFLGGYALCGAYWHDSFGRPQSHGCVNLSLYDAWWLYRWQASSVYIY